MVTANAGNWATVAQALGAHDGACAQKATNLNAQTLIFYVDTFLDSLGDAINIPVGSTINSVKVGFHNKFGTNPTEISLTLFILHVPFTIGVDGSFLGTTPSCSLCADSETDVQPFIGFTVAELNAQDFTVWASFNTGVIAGWVHRAFIDCIWITVDYTEPPVSGAAGVSTASVVAFISAMGSWVRRKRRKKIIAVSLG